MARGGYERDRYRRRREAKAALPAGFSPTSPGSLIGLLSERSNTGAETARIHSTERLLLIPVTAPGAIAKADALVNAMESPLLTQDTCVLRYGEIRVELLGEKQKIVINIIDQGEGIAPGQENKVFEPFYTTKPVGEGTGLGLSVVHGIIKSYKGTIRHGPNKPKGTIFTLEFPK